MAINQGFTTIQSNPNPLSLPVSQRFTRDASGLVTQLRPTGFQACKDLQTFTGSIVGQVTTVGAATTYTGLCLSNPIGSTVNLVVKKAGIAFLVAFPAAAAIGLMTGYNATTDVTHTTPAVVRNAYMGAPIGQGKLDSAATLPTAPVLHTVLGVGLTAAITTNPSIPGFYDIAGDIVLPPGGYVAVYTSTVSGAAAGAFSLGWEEVAV